MPYYFFKLEDVAKEFDKYDELSNMLIEFAKETGQEDIVREILTTGEYSGYKLSSSITNRDNPLLEGKRRFAAAYLAIRNPETFKHFCENQVKLFHGTNGNALESILNNGLQSQKTSEEKGTKVTTGEKWSRFTNHRDFVSFTDVLPLAEAYSSVDADEGEKNKQFEVIIGTNANEILRSKKVRVKSDYSEVGVLDTFPVESIKIIGVPSEKIEMVKKMVGIKNIIVSPIDDIENKFYYVDDMGDITIFDDVAEDFHKYLKDKNNKVEKKRLKDALAYLKRYLSINNYGNDQRKR